jgi:hypothetical protein
MTPVPLLQVAGLVLLLIPITLLLHELAHAAAVLAVGGHVSLLEMGTGHPLPLLRVKGSRVQLRANIYGGGRVEWNAVDFGYRRRLVVISAGPASHLLPILALLPFVGASWEVMTVLGVSAVMLVGSVVPATHPSGLPNDARHLATLLRVRPTAGTNGAAMGASLLARAGDGDVKPLLKQLDQVHHQFAPGSSERLEAWRLRAYALSVQGRFEQAARLCVGGDPVVFADHQACAALFGQLTLTDPEIERLAETFTEALSAVSPDRLEHRAALAHSLAVARLLQGQADVALTLLDEAPCGASTHANRAAVAATRGVAMAQHGELVAAGQVLHDLTQDAPWSPWVRLLADAVKGAGRASTKSD